MRLRANDAGEMELRIASLASLGEPERGAGEFARAHRDEHGVIDQQFGQILDWRLLVECVCIDSWNEDRRQEYFNI
jgi:hypothetical protein